MKILFASFEVAPFAKVGGLADVAGALPLALTRLGHKVAVAMPAFAMVLRDHPVQALTQFEVPINPHWTVPATAYRLDHNGVDVWLIDGGGFFDQAEGSETIYRPGLEQHLFFQTAVLQLAKDLEWKPDVIHAHDWQQGFVPVLQRTKFREEFEGTASLFTIHNHAYQGEFGIEVLDRLGLDRSLFHPEAVEAWGAVNFLKAGMVFADHANTVSPTYARQIQTTPYGNRLEGLMAHLASQGRLSGILNGIDTQEFDPATDPRLPSHYDAANPGGKQGCRAALHQALDLKDNGEPILGMVTRVSRQKGLDLVLQALPELVHQGARVVVQGLGDADLVDALRQAEREFPHHFRTRQVFDEGLARLVYSGSDLFLMPSAFEPCGLGQMIAMRYGTLPVVRATGGLADTVEDGVDGFSFVPYDAGELTAAASRGIAAIRDSAVRTRMVRHVMEKDLSWTNSARAYERLYESLIRTRALA